MCGKTLFWTLPAITFFFVIPLHCFVESFLPLCNHLSLQLFIIFNRFSESKHGSFSPSILHDEFQYTFACTCVPALAIESLTALNTPFRMAPIRTHDSQPEASTSTKHDTNYKSKRHHRRPLPGKESAAPGVSKIKSSLRQTRRLLTKVGSKFSANGCNLT